MSKQEADEKISLAATADAQVQAAQANLQRLRELSGFKKIVAPFDGVVTARNTDVGQLINAGSGSGPELFRIADTRKLRLYVRVPQTYAALMHAESRSARCEFPDRPGMTYHREARANLERAGRDLAHVARAADRGQLEERAAAGRLRGSAFQARRCSRGATSFKLPANVLLFRGDGRRSRPWMRRAALR